MIYPAFELGKRLNIPISKIFQAFDAFSKKLNLKNEIPQLFLTTIINNKVPLNKIEEDIMLTLTTRKDGWEELTLAILIGTTHYPRSP